MKDLPSCPICDASSPEIYLDDRDVPLDPSAIGSSRQHFSPGRILRCRVCGAGFRQLRSSPEQLRELYRNMDRKVYDSELTGRDRTARRHLQILQQHLRPGRLLDVGCASGLFLLRASGQGWHVTGIEPNEALCAEARQQLNGRAEIHCATLETAHLPCNYDAITLWDVLEHVSDPTKFLKTCGGLLSGNGFVFLNVPDLDSREARILGRRWPLLLPEHLNYFTRKSLALCAERAGLNPVQFGRRMAWFSLKYVAYRIGQHAVPGAGLFRRAAATSIGGLLVPVSLGETYAVLKRA